MTCTILITANGDSSNSSDEKEKEGPSHHHHHPRPEEENIHPRKRKLRHRTEEPPRLEPNTSSSSQVPPLPQHDKLENPYELYVAIRRQVCRFKVLQPPHLHYILYIIRPSFTLQRQ